MLTEKSIQLFDNSRIKNYATTKSKEVYAKVITNGGSSFIISVPLLMRYFNFGGSHSPTYNTVMQIRWVWYEFSLSACIYKKSVLSINASCKVYPLPFLPTWGLDSEYYCLTNCATIFLLPSFIITK